MEQQWETLENNKKTEYKTIALPSLERILFVKTCDIIRCKGENNYTNVYLQNGQTALISRTLKDFEELLSEEGFIRVHQSHLVNKKMVCSFEKRDGGYLLLRDNASVPISRMRKDNVMKELGMGNH